MEHIELCVGIDIQINYIPFYSIWLLKLKQSKFDIISNSKFFIYLKACNNIFLYECIRNLLVAAQKTTLSQTLGNDPNSASPQGSFIPKFLLARCIFATLLSTLAIGIHMLQAYSHNLISCYMIIL